MVWRHGRQSHPIRTPIPIKADPAANRRRNGSRGGRPPTFDRERYKQRNTAERAFNKLRQFRAVARHDERDYMYKATVDIVTTKIWLRELTQDRRATAWRYSVRSAVATRVRAAQPAGTSAPSTARTTPASPRAANKPGW